MFWNEDVLRCNLVHFETDIILRNVTVRAMALSRLGIFPIILLPIYLNDNNNFGEEAGHFGGEASTPQIPKTY